MYTILQHEENYVRVKTRWELEWENKYGHINWNEVYQVLKNKLPDRKAVDIHWLMLQCGLYTEAKLQKINLSDGLCKYCTVDIETSEHLFYECELVERTWEVIGQMIEKTWNTNCNTDRFVIFAQTEDGIDKNVAQVLQYIVISCKFILWKRSKLLKHEEMWINDSETVKWISNYLRNRTRILLKTKISRDCKRELKKLLIATDSLG